MAERNQKHLLASHKKRDSRKESFFYSSVAFFFSKERECFNHSGISHLSIPGKVLYAKCLEKKMKQNN